MSIGGLVSVSGDEMADDRIERALHAFLAGDIDRLRAVISSDPELVNLSWQGNTLLEWATQPPHGIDPAIIQVLIDHGAHLDRALNLAGCWNLPDLCRQLLTGGADPTARADAGITPLESAAMHGSTDAVDILVGYGLHRPGLWLAAAAGHLDVVRSWVDSTGALLKPPGPYRPNWADVGRPPGAEPTDDPNEIIGEALVLAAANGRAEVVDHMLDVGANVDARTYRNTTGLHLAIQFHKPEIVRVLLARGASSDIVDDGYGSDAAGWAAACNDGTPAATTVLAELRASDTVLHVGVGHFLASVALFLDGEQRAFFAEGGNSDAEVSGELSFDQNGASRRFYPSAAITPTEARTAAIDFVTGDGVQPPRLHWAAEGDPPAA